MTVTVILANGRAFEVVDISETDGATFRTLTPKRRIRKAKPDAPANVVGRVVVDPAQLARFRG